MSTEISVTRQDARTAGSCLACSDHTDEHGCVPHEVWQIDLRNMSFRVCARCRLELLTQLVIRGATEMELRQTFGVLGSALDEDIRKRLTNKNAPPGP